MTDVTEHIDRLSAADLCAAATPPQRRKLGIAEETVGTAFVSLAAALPPSAIVINRTIGLGLGSEERRETVRAIAERYRAAGVSRYFVHLHPDSRPADLENWLTEEGLEPARGWMKFTRGREPVSKVKTPLTVRPAEPGDAPAMGRIAAAAFDLGEEAEPWLGCLIGRPGWHVYMSLDGGRPAGTGVFFIHGDVAYLTFGATDPEFRGRGGQSALLSSRISDALDLDCRLLVTETGEDVPGDPQHSYNNIVRMGFQPAYLRRNFAPPRKG